MSVHTDHQTKKPQELADRAIKLYTFLQELIQLQLKPVKHVNQYEKVFWLNNLPRESHVQSVFVNSRLNLQNSEYWLEISKPEIQNAPKPPFLLEKWLNSDHLSDFERQFPELLESIQISHGDDSKNTQKYEIKDVRSEVLPLWESYIADEWWPWQKKAKMSQPSQKLFSDFFSLYQRQEKFGEAYEVVMGFGCLLWKNADGETIQRHLFTVPVNVVFDADKSLIRISPSAEGLEFSLEQEMLDLSQQVDPETAALLQAELQVFPENADERTIIKKALMDWMNRVEPAGEYVDALSPDTQASQRPRIFFAPAIILRKRTDQMLLRAFAEIVSRIRRTGEIPPAVASLVSVENNQLAAANGGHRQPDDIYFPLPANDEQVEILHKIRGQRGVVVQGPPGTGKSHTIANLIAHYLAEGKRVLVTSHTARALKVLRKMLPQEIASLCVVALGDDERALSALESSVNGITSRHHYWEPAKNEVEIQRLTEKLVQSKMHENAILAEFQRIRTAETEPVNPGIGNYSGTLSNIAARLQREKEQYGWLKDAISNTANPVLNNEMLQGYLKDLRQLLPSQEVVLKLNLIDPEKLLSPVDFFDCKTAEETAQSRLENVKVDLRRLGKESKRELYMKIPQEQRQAVIALLDQLLDTLNALDYHSYPWVRKAAQEVMDGRQSVWEILLRKSLQHLKMIKQSIDRVTEVKITGIGGKDLRVVKEHALNLLAHLSNAGSLRFGIFLPRQVKDALYLTKDVFVNGVPCDEKPQLETLVEYIDVADQFERLSGIWSIYTETPNKAPLDLQLAEYKHYLDPLKRVLELHQTSIALKAMLAATPELNEREAERLEQLRELHTILGIVDLEEAHKTARAPFEELQRLLGQKIMENNTHPILKELLTHVENRDENRYESTLQTLKNVWQLRNRLENRNNITHELEKHAPLLVEMLMENPHNSIWDSRLENFEEARNWALMMNWMNAQQVSEAEKQLKKDLESNQKNIRKLTATLAAAKAWQHTFRRMSENERQSLEAWGAAMRRVGKGTGKYAHSDRRKAREHLENCRNAIPAWVMPIYRVAETMNAAKEAFDVVIVDEASQSGPEALLLAYLAKQIIVVGDDKQISPEFIGVNRADVEKLREKYLQEIPFNDAIGVENSFFDLAKIRYGNPIRLREHFRSMPEIIGFSNQLCYQNEPLVPLRQYGSSRLSPVIVRRFVGNGEAQPIGGGLVNVAEAEMLVKQIQRCCEETAYGGKSMGVISLQGSAQARFIEKLLLKTIGAAEMEQRNIVCGDAYAFQGDERDVMFLSMVAAPNRRIGTLASEKDMRRFNVAFSRARDQVFLFHSVMLENLSENGLRNQLLSYCMRPVNQHISLENMDVAYLWEQANVSSRDRVSPPEPFDNWFELDVYLKLVEQGAKVMAGYEIDRYRIDLLIEGLRGRIGIECLGESIRKTEDFSKNVLRKQRLERCGWKFVPVYGSEFYHNPEKALEKIWKVLAENSPQNGVYFNGSVKSASTKISLSESA